MAIVNQGTQNNLPAGQIPSGYVMPVVAGFSDYEYVRKLTLSVLKATVETASPEDTMTAIFDNPTIGINKQITDIITAEYLDTPAVTAYGSLKVLTTNVSDITDKVYLTNAPVSYVCKVQLFVKSI
jgi:hypothetical protein